VALLAALPLAGDETIVLPLESEHWQTRNRHVFADEFLWRANAPNGPALLVQARQVIILLGALLIVAIFLWGRALLGLWGALIAATLAAFDPNLIANSRQVTTDIGVTLFLFLALWALWWWLARGGWWALLLAGLGAGAAMGAKYSGLYFWPAALLVLLIHPTGGERVVWRRLGALLVMGLVAASALWALYRFDSGWVEIGGMRLWLPLRFYLQNLVTTLGGLIEMETPNFLLGEVSTGGWWYYFPVAMAVKTPLPLLLLTVVGIAAMLKSRSARAQVALWGPALVLLALALTGLVTIGYRHILPLLPAACLLAGNSVRWVRPPQRIWPVGLIAAALASLIVTTI
ncbi:MAG: glycosyltransferase family 39 protein, partial [Caldilineaceae bacterium]